MCVIKYLLSQATRMLLTIPPMNLFVENNHDDRLNCKASIESVTSPDKRIITINTKDYVEKIIARNTVAIFSKSYCPYCKMAKQIFDQLNQPYKVIELDERKDGYEILDYLGEMTGVKSVPRVFIKGACIGGGSDCKTLLENGELQKKL
ncbi:hypothetical protein HCN44_006734 [Aphidius gifuensis]|uniref:Glutaredoxin-2, mitochondrial n=1 Tax=Aphidius gifuensis TaxID=684658 RepID=A0A835CTQ9_APHGI|nr:hypothetical protein HCN44_006734 [Aphidius gifuensis]